MATAMVAIKPRELQVGDVFVHNEGTSLLVVRATVVDVRRMGKRTTVTTETPEPGAAKPSRGSIVFSDADVLRVERTTKTAVGE